MFLEFLRGFLLYNLEGLHVFFDARISVIVTAAVLLLIIFRVFGQVTNRPSHKVSDHVTNVRVETRT